MDDEDRLDVGDVMVSERVAAAWLQRLRSDIVGLEVGAVGGQPYINLDNAASTPALRTVREAVDALLPWYGSVNRGAGQKSSVMSAALQDAREVLLGCVGAGREHEVVFVRSATEGLNILAHRSATGADATVITTEMEHHANLLPWRRHATVLHAPVDDEGRLDLEVLEDTIRRAPRAPRVVTVSGASNVTGVLPPVAEIAEIAHRHGAWCVVDAAQLAPHRAIDLTSWDVDAIALSGHKVYAPYGGGAVIARRELLEQGEPLLRGGGMAQRVSLHGQRWCAPPASDEAGSPNIVGSIALAVAMDALRTIGFDRLIEHDRRLTAHLLAGLRGLPGTRVLGPAEASDDRVATVALELDHHDAELVAAALAQEHGVAVRTGRFCAHPLVDRLSARSDGAVLRFSAGMYTAPDEVDHAIAGLGAILNGETATYARDPATGRYVADGGPALPRDAFDLRALLADVRSRGHGAGSGAGDSAG